LSIGHDPAKAIDENIKLIKAMGNNFFITYP
jgi:hypothetical protein